MDIRAAVAEFLLDRESLGRAPKTLRFYRTQLGQFSEFMVCREHVAVSDVTRSTVRAFFASLHRREIRQGTLAAYDRALRTFCRFCQVEGWLCEDPFKGRPRIKPSHSLPDTFELSEIGQLLETCDGEPLGIRDRAIMLLMLDTGLRAGEVVTLTEGQLDMNGDRGTISISADESKGVNDRVVPFWQDTLVALRSWLAVRPVGAETVFVASDGTQLTKEPLTTSGLNQIMRRRCRDAGVEPKDRLCHIWRHTFAKAYVRDGGDLETLRRMLGHATLDTVRIYLGFKTEEIEALHFEHSPVRQLAKQNGT